MRWRRRLGSLAIVAAVACIIGMAAREMWMQQERKQEMSIEVLAPAAQVLSEARTDAPRVLIYHTHTWEAYRMTADTEYVPTETWRTQDNRYNMVRVGEALAAELEKRGFIVEHDTTAFEPPDLSGAYVRSLEMLSARKAAGEQYDYVFDVHRDAYSGLWNGANGVEVGGESCAYVMMLVGKGTGTTGSGFDERPDWPKNLELAQQITDAMNALAPGVAREVKIKTGRFNQHVSPCALLIEVGNNENTLAEALCACSTIAQSIADVHALRALNAP